MTSPIDLVEMRSLRDDIPEFAPGDTLKVHVRVVEGSRERIQVFQGVVIRRQGTGARETFTVRKVSFGVGVERTFPVHSPIVAKIEVVARGQVRRAKLYYLRDRVGKAAKVKENELLLYREYRDVSPMFRYIVDTERRFYLANGVEQHVRTEGGRTWIELVLHDAWVWDLYRQNRFVSRVTVTTFRDVNIEELALEDLA